MNSTKRDQKSPPKRGSTCPKTSGAAGQNQLSGSKTKPQDVEVYQIQTELPV